MKNGNKSDVIRRFNVFDLIVILLVIVLIASFIYRIYVGADKVSDKSVGRYAISFESDAEYNSLLNYVKEGDAVYFEHNGVLLGYLYAGDDDENGAVYELIDDIPTFAEDGSTDVSVESENAEIVAEGCKYKKIKIAGQIRLNVDTVKVKNAGHYVIGDTNICEGRVINVYTETAVFTLTVKDIFIVE